MLPMQLWGHHFTNKELSSSFCVCYRMDGCCSHDYFFQLCVFFMLDLCMHLMSMKTHMTGSATDSGTSAIWKRFCSSGWTDAKLIQTTNLYTTEKQWVLNALGWILSTSTVWVGFPPTSFLPQATPKATHGAGVGGLQNKMGDGGLGIAVEGDKPLN